MKNAEIVFDVVKRQQLTMTSTDEPMPSSDEMDFVFVEHEVRATGPCICGSDKTFGECCGHEIVDAQRRKVDGAR